MFERQLIFLEVVPSIVNPQAWFSRLQSSKDLFRSCKKKKKKTWISEQHDTSFPLTKYYSYWNVFYLVKMRNLNLVSIWSLRWLYDRWEKNFSDRSDDKETTLQRSLECGFHMIAAIAELSFSLSDCSDHSNGSDHMEFILETNYPSRRIIHLRWIIRL